MEIKQEIEQLKKLAAIQQESLETMQERMEILRRAVEALSRIALAVKTTEGQADGRN